MQEPIDYLAPRLPPGLARVPMPIVEATSSALEGYGCLIDDPNEHRVKIVRWPATGRRPVDAGTGDQGGTTEGVFVSEWRGDVLYGGTRPSAAITFWPTPSPRSQRARITRTGRGA